MWGRAYFDIRNVPVRFTSTVWSHSSSGQSGTVRGKNTPALLNRRSIFLNVLIVSSTARLQSEARRTSERMKIPSPPALLTSCRTTRPRTSSRPVSATLAPSRANSTAVARPIPEVPPVMSATFPSSRIGSALLARDEPAVHDKRSPAHERRGVRGEVERRLRDVLRPRHAPERHLRRLLHEPVERLAEHGRLASQHRRVGVAGADAVHPDVLRAVVERAARQIGRAHV